MDEKTFTQEEVNSIVQERLDRAEKKFAEKLEGFMSADEVEGLKKGYEEQISKLNESISAQSEKYAEFDKTIEEKDAKIKAFETGSIKTRIAHEVGLSYDAVKYLQGDTEEEIKESAEGLKSLVGGAFVAPLATTDSTPKDTKGEAMRNMLREMKGV